MGTIHVETLKKIFELNLQLLKKRLQLGWSHLHCNNAKCNNFLIIAITDIWQIVDGEGECIIRIEKITYNIQR